VDQQKALFVAWLAAPRDLPIAVYVRGELQGIFPYCEWAWRRVDAAIGMSTSSLQYLHSTRYAHGNLQVIYSGIDVDSTLDRARLGPKDFPGTSATAHRLVFPAHLGGPAKGHECGIRAVARFIEAGGQARLLICGSVPPGASSECCNMMRRLASALKVQEYVHFLGYRDDILSVMAKSDIVFLPSFTEGVPRSLMEAMALAKPVIDLPPLNRSSW